MPFVHYNIHSFLQSCRCCTQWISSLSGLDWMPSLVMPVVNLDEYNEEDPASFYLERDSLRESADAFLVVGGVELPVHTGLLAVQSPVLEQAFMVGNINRKSGAGAAVADCEERPLKRARHSNFFDGFTVKEVAVFLRLLYDPSAGTSQSIAALPQHLPAIARLAHRFNVRHLLKAAEARLLTRAMNGVQLNSTLRLAEELNLREVLVQGIVMAAHSLCTPSSGSELLQQAHSGLMEVAQLTDGLGPVTTQLLLGAVASAVKMAAVEGGTAAAAATKLATQGYGQVVPQIPALSDWLDLHGDRGDYTWVIPDCAAAITADRDLESPEFVVGSQAFRLVIGLVRGYGQQWAAVWLEAVGTQDWAAGKVVHTCAAVRFTLVNRIGNLSHVWSVVPLQGFTAEQPRIGVERFLPASAVTQPGSGFVVRDKLTLRVEVAL